MIPRTHTPDRTTTTADGRTITHLTLKRDCNGCGQRLGDLEDRDISEDGHPTDVRRECPNCRPLVDLEAVGCRTWHITPRNINRPASEIDRYGVFTKGYWQEVDGQLEVVGLRIGTGETRVVARWGDWIVRHPSGRWSVHKGPATTNGDNR